MMAKPFAEPSFLRTIGLVLLAIVALFAVDMFLAGLERVETRAEATRQFQQGRVLMQRGDNAEAIKRIKDAIAIERGNRDYRRTLAQAQLASGNTADAETTLSELLQSDSSDSLASLIMGAFWSRRAGLRRRSRTIDVRSMATGTKTRSETGSACGSN